MSDISKKMHDALNHQIAYEAYASNFYLAIAYWCDSKALTGCKQFFLRQSQEEREHMLKIFEYMSDSGLFPSTPTIEQPPLEYSNIREVFDKVYDQERVVTKAIHNLVKIADEDKDYATGKFLEWYVEEQREEETVIRNIIDRLELIGDGAMSLYYIDKEVEKINQDVMAAEANA
jgi:ferritin